MDKVVAAALEAVADVPDGATPWPWGGGLAAHRAPAGAGTSFAGLDVLERNEALAAPVPGCVAERPESDPAILEPQGGAITVGLSR